MTALISPNIPTTELDGIAYVRLAKGELKPLDSVKPEHVLEDELVRRLTIKAAAINAQLAAFRAEVFADVQAFRDILAEKYDVKRGGRRGGIVLSTVDTSHRLTITISDKMEFGPEMESAKELIDGCIRRWSNGGNVNIKALVDDAFQVDKAGKINVDRILGLRRHKMDDETGDWAKAMDIISDAVRVMSSKEYARFFVIDRETGGEHRISLDIASA